MKIIQFKTLQRAKKNPIILIDFITSLEQLKKIHFEILKIFVDFFKFFSDKIEPEFIKELQEIHDRDWEERFYK